MIRVRRDQPPSVLTDEDGPGLRERAEAEAAYAEYLEAIQDGAEDKGFKFSFSVYKHADVKERLEELFHGKCAYCESRYSSTRPMDVEHYRPKGRVAESEGHPGYYWLAAEWTNLLPSCIDCNRRRNQFDERLQDLRSLRKQDQFPGLARDVIAE